MGVISCHRGDCENIMCDRGNNKYGNICNECFEELVCTGPETNIEYFMQSKKKSRSTQREEAEARYNVAFPSRYDD